MKTITPEFKKQIFAQYFGSTYYYKNEYGNFKEKVEFGYHTNKHIEYDKAFLYLTKLSNLTDEDCLHIANLCFHDSINTIKKYPEYIELVIDECNDLLIYHDGRICTAWRENVSCKDVESEQQIVLYLKCIDYLRSKGYALPYLDYSVEDLVELGVYKLK